MPIPQLNTNGIDITNTLMNIDAMKSRKVNRDYQSKQNALLDEQLSPKAIANRNAIRDYKLKAAELEKRTNMFNFAEKGMKWAMNGVAAGDENAYKVYYDTMIKAGFPETALISPDSFYVEKEDKRAPGNVVKQFDKDRFLDYGRRTIATASQLFEMGNKEVKKKYTTKIIYNHKNGDTLAVPVAVGETYDPKVNGPDWSFEKPKDITAPETRKYQKGNKIITEEFNPTTNSWKEIGSGPVKSDTDKTQKLMERRTKLSSELFQKNKYGEEPSIDQKGAKAIVDEINELNKKLGIDEEIVWKDKEEIETEKEKGVLNNILDYFWTSEDEDKGKEGAYVRVAKGKEKEKEENVDSDFVEINGKKVPKVTDEEGVSRLLREGNEAIKAGAPVDAVTKRIELLTGQKVTYGKPEDK